MATLPQRISLASLQAKAVRWRSDEAIAFLVQLGERLRWRDTPPPAESIYLLADGTVELGGLGGPPATAERYAELLHALLPEPERGRLSKVPGRVRILVARALGQTTLPPLISAEEFGTRLKTVAPEHPTVVLADLVRRSLSNVGNLDSPWDNLHPLATRVGEWRRPAPEGHSPTAPSEDRRPIHRAEDARSFVRPAPGALRADGGIAPSTVHDNRRGVIPAFGSRVSRRNARLILSLLGVMVLVLAVVGLTTWGVAPRNAVRVATTTARSVQAPSGNTDTTDAHAAHRPEIAGSSVPHSTTTADARDNERARPRSLATPAMHRALVPVALRGALTYSPSFGSSADTLFFHAESPEGARLMEARTDTDGQPRAMAVLLTDDARNYHVRMSPDGQRLAYDSDRDGERGVYVKPVNTDAAERVSGPGYAAVPVWAPDGHRLAFVRAEPNSTRVWNLWIADLPSRRQRRLTNYRVGQVWPGNWFQDGQHLIYTHETNLFVLDTISGKRQSYETPIAGRLLRTASVSSDGRRVAFQVYRDGLWILDLRTGRMTRWLADPSAEEFAWSPDDSRLAFHSRRGGRWSVWTMAAPMK